jgi:hypothetical protein
MTGMNANICPSGFSGAAPVAHPEGRKGGLALREVLDQRRSG